MTLKGGLAAGSPKTARTLMQATGAGPMDNADEVVAKWIESVEARLRVLEHCANPMSSPNSNKLQTTPQTPKPVYNSQNPLQPLPDPKLSGE